VDNSWISLYSNGVIAAICCISATNFLAFSSEPRKNLKDNLACSIFPASFNGAVIAAVIPAPPAATPNHVNGLDTILPIVENAPLTIPTLLFNAVCNALPIFGTTLLTISFAAIKMEYFVGTLLNDRSTLFTTDVVLSTAVSVVLYCVFKERDSCLFTSWAFC